MMLFSSLRKGFVCRKQSFSLDFIRIKQSRIQSYNGWVNMLFQDVRKSPFRNNLPLQDLMKSSPMIHLKIFVDLIAEIWQWRLDFYLQALKIKGYCRWGRMRIFPSGGVCYSCLSHIPIIGFRTPNGTSRKLYTPPPPYFQETDLLYTQ